MAFRNSMHIIKKTKMLGEHDNVLTEQSLGWDRQASFLSQNIIHTKTNLCVKGLPMQVFLNFSPAFIVKRSSRSISLKKKKSLHVTHHAFGSASQPAIVNVNVLHSQSSFLTLYLGSFTCSKLSPTFLYHCVNWDNDALVMSDVCEHCSFFRMSSRNKILV